MKNLNRILAMNLGLALILPLHPAHGKTSTALQSLGGTKAILERASQLESRTRVSIVQNRAVKRDWRLELGVNYGPTLGGDSYVQTQNLTGQVDLHVNPKFSLGLRYTQAFNSLTSEGQQLRQNVQDAQENGSNVWSYQDIDYAEQTVMGVLNWYMTYGKINFFDISIIQFDIYSLAGYGQVTLASGNTSGTWTAGGGVGFWLSQHLTSRFEVRYQTYSDHVYTGARDLNLVVAHFGLGVLL